MMIKIRTLPPDPLRDWHEWFAWHPVIAKPKGCLSQAKYVEGSYFVWLQKVLRKKVSNTDLTWWLYEIL